MANLSIEYADPLSGVMADKIMWINWGNLMLYQETNKNVIVDLPNGYTMSFTISNDTMINSEQFIVNVLQSGTPVKFGRAFDIYAYTGLDDKKVMLFFNGSGYNDTRNLKFSLNNIQIRDANNNKCTATVHLVSGLLHQSDATSMQQNEYQTISTDGQGWTKLMNISDPTISPTSPIIDDTDSKNIQLTINNCLSYTPVYSTNSPTNISIEVRLSLQYSPYMLYDWAVGISNIQLINESPTRGINLYI